MWENIIWENIIEYDNLLIYLEIMHRITLAPDSRVS
jgi:hypothetical protein